MVEKAPCAVTKILVLTWLPNLARSCPHSPTTRCTSHRSALRRICATSCRSVLGYWGNTIWGAVRNKERWKGHRTPTQEPSTNDMRDPVQSRPDAHSPLGGAQLIAQKVKLVVWTWAPEWFLNLGRLGFEIPPPEKNALVFSTETGRTDAVPLPRRAKHPVLTRPISNR